MKATPKRQIERRRYTLGGIVSNQVVIPGSPAISVPELLGQGGRDLPHSKRTVEVTPLRYRPLSSDPFVTPDGFSTPAGVAKSDPAHPWTRQEWKLLDGCLTDERIRLGASLGAGYSLAPVDEVDVDDVVDRFRDVGGSTACHWDRLVHLLSL